MKERRLLGTDLVRGLTNWPLWIVIGWLEVAQRYRRSMIGPFWITISLAVTVGALGVVYGALFNQTLSDYIPFVAVGLICWFLLSALIIDGCNVFIAAEASIKMLPVPLSIYVYRMIWKNIIILLHNFVVYVAVVLIFGVNPGLTVLLALPGLLLIALNGVGFGLTLGVLSARFRDIPLMITNAVQLIFFITPILWKPGALAARPWVYEINPFYYLIEIVRAPLLGTAPSATVFMTAVVFTAANLTLAILFYARFRRRVAYWI